MPIIWLYKVINFLDISHKVVYDLKNTNFSLGNNNEYK